MSTIVITGASSGIGRATATQLVEAGHEVVGLARRTEAMPAGVTGLPVDLAADGALAQAFSRDPLAGRRIDIAIHCAGYGAFAPLETTSLNEARRQLEVNVLAAVDLAQQVLPGMRAAGAGRIVLVSSIASGFSSPMGGWYHATKAALESLADTLRQEVGGDGIDVVVVQPGLVRTPWHDTAMDGLEARVAGTAYEQLGVSTAAYHRSSADSAMVCEREDVATAIIQAATTPKPRTRYRVGRGARAAMLVPRLLPDRVFDRLTLAQFGAAHPSP